MIREGEQNSKERALEAAKDRKAQPNKRHETEGNVGKEVRRDKKGLITVHYLVPQDSICHAIKILFTLGYSLTLEEIFLMAIT